MTRPSALRQVHASFSRSRPWWALASGYAAFTWAVLFALVNIYLQLGGADPTQHGISHRYTGWITVLNLSVVPIKLTAAIVALGLVQRWGERLPHHLRRLLLVAAWGACAILVGYPVVGLSLTAAVQSGMIQAPPAGFKVGGGFEPRVFLYGGFFLVAGILYGIAAWDYRRATSRAR